MSKEEFFNRPEVADSREDILGLVEKGIVKEQHVTLLGDLPDKDIPELYARLQEVQGSKKAYMRLRGKQGVSQDYVTTRLAELGAEEEKTIQ